VGQIVLLCHPGDGCRKALVSDCCNELEGHCRAMRDKGIVAEVGHNCAKRWGVIGFSPDNIPVAVIRYAR
jgi:hypothetical protein